LQSCLPHAFNKTSGGFAWTLQKILKLEISSIISWEKKEHLHYKTLFGLHETSKTGKLFKLKEHLIFC
jgi:hypothetical protein